MSSQNDFAAEVERHLPTDSVQPVRNFIFDISMDFWRENHPEDSRYSNGKRNIYRAYGQEPFRRLLQETQTRWYSILADGGVIEVGGKPIRLLNGRISNTGQHSKVRVRRSNSGNTDSSENSDLENFLGENPLKGLGHVYGLIFSQLNDSQDICITEAHDEIRKIATGRNLFYDSS